MREKYTIRILPPNSITKDDHPKRREKDYLKIRGNTFPHIPLKLRIRPKSAYFTKNVLCSSPTYAVLYADEDTMECLFVFKYQHTSRGDVLYLSRCVGKTITKHHKDTVLSFLEKHEARIQSLLPNQSIRF